MVTLVVWEIKHMHIGARPLMLPLQQTDICIATQKEILMNGYNYPNNLLASFFLLEEELVSKKVL